MIIKQNLLRLKRLTMICSITVSYLNGSVKIANISFEELGVLFISGILKNPDTYTYFCNIHGNYISIEDITNVIEPVSYTHLDVYKRQLPAFKPFART